MNCFWTDLKRVTQSCWGINAINTNTLSIATEDSFAQDVFFKPDGKRMFIVGATGDRVYEYDLSIPWNISSATYNGIGESFSTSPTETSPHGIAFRPDGLRAFLSGATLDGVHELDLSTAWDISTASFNVGESFSVAAQDIAPVGPFFKPDGLKLFITGSSTNRVLAYNLGAAWDVSTSVYAGDSAAFDYTGQLVSAIRSRLMSNGTVLAIHGTAPPQIKVKFYDLGVAYDVSTAVYRGASNDVILPAAETDGRGLVFSTDESKMYVIGLTTGTLYEYDI